MPRLLAAMLAEWNLIPTGDPISGTQSLVQPVTDPDGRRRALKVPRLESDDHRRGETATLQLWKGRGAVGLVRADPRRGVLLLEWLGRPLAEEMAGEACAEIAQLYARLHRPAAPQLPSHSELVSRWLDEMAALGSDVPAPPRFVSQALTAGRELIWSRPAHVIHGDLHDGNVLWRGKTQEWVAIDPQGYNGDPCCEPGPMLWSRWEEHEWHGNPGESIRDRFYALIDGASLDERRSRDWVVVRAMINVSRTVLGTRRDRRDLTRDNRTWITRNITLAKAMQDVRP